jgi:ribosome-associated protein
MSNTPVSPESVDMPKEVARAVELMFDRKAVDVTLLDLRGISSATDWFVVAGGTSDTHVGAIADSVLDGLRKERVKPLNTEGEREGRWVLIDYFDFVVHVFHPAAREFYQLEMLWGDAPTYLLAPSTASAA